MPAGIRLPRSFKLTHTEKIPHIINKLKQQGADPELIEQAISRKQEQVSDRYGNRDTVGLLIKMNHPDLNDQRLKLDRDKYIRKFLHREVSEFNRSKVPKLNPREARFHKKVESVRLEKKHMIDLRMNQSLDEAANWISPPAAEELSANRYNMLTNAASRTIYSHKSNPVNYRNNHRYNTINKEVFTQKEIPSFTPYKKNFKKKS